MGQIPLYERVRDIIESARAGAARSVNTAQVVSNWLIGREIVEEQQGGKAKAEYGERLLRALAERLRREYGSGYGLTNLKMLRQFYLTYDGFLGSLKGHAVSDLFRKPRAPRAAARAPAGRPAAPASKRPSISSCSQ